MLGDAVSLDDARREIQAIVDSGIFAPTSRQALLLEYLFNKVANGREGDLKEFTVAVELFHKSEDFDSHLDATVRVEAHRLRKKLEKYYETFGRDRGLRAVLPAGQYVLQFQTASPESSRVNGPPVLAAASRAVPEPKHKTLPLKAWIAGFLAAAALLGFAGLWYARLPRPLVIAKQAAAAGQDTVADPDPEPDAIRIMAGRTGLPFVDNAGRRWGDDRFFEGGVIRKVSHEILFRTSRPQMFQTVREGTFRYRIPLPPGEYEMHLYFTDPDVPGVELGPERRFRILAVRINGQHVLTFDLAAEIGCNADIRSFAHLRPNSDGILDVYFLSARGPAAVSALEILPMHHGEIRPVRVVAQPRPFLDIQKRFWNPDDYYSGGNFGDFPATINGGVDPGIFSLDRCGDFEYFIPVPEGRYQVNLYFGEAYHGRGQPGGGGVGSRVFDVLLNNEMLLRDFDILRQAPPMRLITQTARQVKPDWHGKIHLTFATKAHFASVRAIEVLPEN
jgi:hypothetical protein